ncbi:MAG: sugar ABC transporter permease [Chloroflexi bacterium]|nr:MAG: sugar ABC transporter permease [Chloroflexota bacterium]
MASDELFWKSLFNTVYLTVVGVPISLAAALVAALALNMRVPGQWFFRTIVFLPTVVPVVAATYIWRWLLNAQYGYVNEALGTFHLGQPLWLDDAIWTKPALILMSLWVTGSAMIVFLAALKDVPEVYYEAATVDGAGAWSKFRHVTLPLISPVILFETIIAGIFTLQYFTQAYLLSQTRFNGASGGPDNSLLVYGLYLFQQAFVNLNMGYASAMAWVLLFVALIGTLVLLRLSRDRVFYAGD